MRFLQGNSSSLLGRSSPQPDPSGLRVIFLALPPRSRVAVYLSAGLRPSLDDRFGSFSATLHSFFSSVMLLDTGSVD